MAAVLVPITMFICIFGMITITSYIDRTAKHKERMALIEHGVDASIFEKKKKKKKEKPNGFGALKFGMLAVGLGVGLVMGAILDIFLNCEPLPHFAMMLICGGGALIGYYQFAAKHAADERDRALFEDKDILV